MNIQKMEEAALSNAAFVPEARAGSQPQINTDETQIFLFPAWLLSIRENLCSSVAKSFIAMHHKRLC
jgi:hypothetical protein